MDMRNILLAGLILAAAPAAAQTYLECGFDGGIPQDFTLIDNDGLEPSGSMKNIGFAVGTPWITETPNGGDGPAAASTSWYAEPGRSDDWMITPPVTIADDGAVLRWRAMASDKNHRDGYAVYVSETGGNTIADFDTSRPLFAVDEEEAEWTVRTVSLDAYKGKTVSIAFVNNSTDKSRLYVDDLYVGVRSSVMLKLDLDRKIPRMGDIAVTGTAYTDDAEPVSGFTIGLEYGGETFTQQFSDVIEPGKPVSFTLDEALPVGFHETMPYRVWIESGASRYEVEGDVTAYPRRVVCEEGTGTWCGWCVRGLVMLDSIKRTCPDWAIGIAAHSGDPMAGDYITAVQRYLGSGGFPCGAVNRTVKADPGDFIKTGRQVFDKEQVLVAMRAEAELDEASQTVKARTSLWFADDDPSADYRLGFAIIENDVHQPGDARYNQQNSYSGGDYGPMGGYEDKPGLVPAEDMWYDDVARGYVGDIAGVGGSVPTVIEADEEVTFANEFALPDGVLDSSNTALVVMLIDQTDGRIVNAVLTPIGDGALTGISAAGEDRAPQPAAYYSTDGTRLPSPRPGLNIVRMSDGTARKTVVPD